MTEYEIELHRQGDSITIGPTEYVTVSFPNSHTAIDEFEIEVPPSQDWEWWAQREGSDMVAYVLEDGARKYSSPQYRGVVDSCQTSMSAGQAIESTVLRGQDATVYLRREGGADRRFQNVLGHEAIRTYVSEELDDFDWTVNEPTVGQGKQDNRIQGDSTDFDVADAVEQVRIGSETYVPDDTFSGLPLTDTADGLQTQQCCWAMDALDRDADSGVTVVQRDDFNGNYGLWMQDSGEYAEWTFTTNYDIPGFDWWYRATVEDDSVTYPKFTLYLNGTELDNGITPGSNLQWTSPLPGDYALDAGTHTLRLEVTSPGDTQAAIDCHAPLDVRFRTSLTFDNELHEPGGYLDGPAHYPPMYIEMVEESVGTDIVTARLDPDFDPFVRENELQLSHDGTEWRPSDGQPTYDSYTNTPGGTAVDVTDTDELLATITSETGNDGSWQGENAGSGGPAARLEGTFDVSAFDQITVYGPNGTSGYADGQSGNGTPLNARGGNGGGSAAIEAGDGTLLAEVGGGAGGGSSEVGDYLDNATASGASEAFDAETSDIRAAHFYQGGDVLFVLYGDSETIERYDCSTPYDPTTRTLHSSLSVGTGATGFTVEDAGRYVFVAEDSQIVRYELNTDWDLSDGVYDTNTFTPDTSDPQDIFWDDIGAYAYVVGPLSVYQYDTFEPYTFVSVFTAGSISFVDTSMSLTGGRFSYDGGRLYLVDAGNGEVRDYECSTSWDVESAGNLRTDTIEADDGIVPWAIDVNELSKTLAYTANASHEVTMYETSVSDPTGVGGDGGGSGDGTNGAAPAAGGGRTADGAGGAVYHDSSYVSDVNTETGLTGVTPGIDLATDFVEVDYSNTPAGTMRGRVRVEPTGFQSNGFPRYGIQPQSLVDWLISVDQSTVPVLNDRRYTGSDFENLVELHEDVGMTFAVEPSAIGNAIPATSVVPTDVERSASWTELSHERNVESRGYANVQRVYGPLRDDGTRLEVTARAQDEIDLVGEVPAEPVTRPGLTNSLDLESEAEKLLRDRVSVGERVRGPITILPKHVTPGFSYQVPEFGDTRVLNSVELTDGVDGPEGVLQFEYSDDFEEIFSSIHTELRSTRQIL